MVYSRATGFAFVAASSINGLAHGTQRPSLTVVDVHPALAEAQGRTALGELCISGCGIADEVLPPITEDADTSHMFLLQTKAQILSHEVHQDATNKALVSFATRAAELRAAQLNPDSSQRSLSPVASPPLVSAEIINDDFSEASISQHDTASDKLDNLLGLAVFFATFCFLHIRSGPSCDAKACVEGGSVGGAAQAETVFQLRVPSLYLAVATLLMLAGSLCMVGLAALGGAHAKQDSLHLWHVVSAESMAQRLLAAAQVLWNGVQVLQCFVVLCCLVTLTRSTLLLAAVCGTFALLPLSLYVTSIGGYAFAILTCLSAYSLAHAERDACLSCFTGESWYISAAEHPGAVYVCKLQALMCACYFFSGQYNGPVYTFRAAFLPNWGWIFDPVRWCMGERAAASLYGLGLDPVVPAFVPRDTGDVIFSAIFSSCWGILPFLYTAAFVVMLASSKELPKLTSSIVRVACVLGIVHFLFFTDVVCYRFGRGFVNPWPMLAHWAHLSEKVCFRAAIFCPVYLKATMGGAKCISSNILQSYAAAFFVVQILLHDLIWQEFVIIGRYGECPWRYFSATTILCCFYFLLCLGTRCDHLVLSPS